jgi:hypothetical protein
MTALEAVTLVTRMTLLASGMWALNVLSPSPNGAKNAPVTTPGHLYIRRSQRWTNFRFWCAFRTHFGQYGTSEKGQKRL